MTHWKKLSRFSDFSDTRQCPRLFFFPDATRRQYWAEDTLSADSFIIHEFLSSCLFRSESGQQSVYVIPPACSGSCLRGGFHRIPPQLQGSVCSFVSKRNFAASTNTNVYKRNCAQRMHETGHRDRLIPSEHEHDWQEHLSFRLSRRHHEGQSVTSHDWGHGVVASVRPAPQRALGPAQSPSNSL